MPPKTTPPPQGPLGGIAPGIAGTASNPLQAAALAGGLPPDVIEKLKADPKVWATVQEEFKELQGTSKAAMEKALEAAQERVTAPKTDAVPSYEGEAPPPGYDGPSEAPPPDYNPKLDPRSPEFDLDAVPPPPVGPLGGIYPGQKK